MGDEHDIRQIWSKRALLQGSVICAQIQDAQILAASLMMSRHTEPLDYILAPVILEIRLIPLVVHSGLI